jgi:hypothetical protein
MHGEKPRVKDSKGRVSVGIVKPDQESLYREVMKAVGDDRLEIVNDEDGTMRLWAPDINLSEFWKAISRMEGKL